ncbi:MAG: hypothetical protein OEY18_15145, partial [Candidatus Aminicenantes bacterium]|nr:hypothetical protein [Candidatus Aminicenantes bacterium]
MDASTDLPPSFSGCGSVIGCNSWPRLTLGMPSTAMAGKAVTALSTNVLRFIRSSLKEGSCVPKSPQCCLVSGFSAWQFGHLMTTARPFYQV